jgi:hypothetical protein
MLDVNNEHVKHNDVSLTASGCIIERAGCMQQVLSVSVNWLISDSRTMGVKIGISSSMLTSCLVDMRRSCFDFFNEVVRMLSTKDSDRV